MGLKPMSMRLRDSNNVAHHASSAQRSSGSTRTPQVRASVPVTSSAAIAPTYKLRAARSLVITGRLTAPLAGARGQSTRLRLRLARRGGLRRGFRFLFGRFRVGLRVGLCVGRLFGGLFRRGLLVPGEIALRFLVVLEVRLVPAAALQAEDRRGDEPLQRRAAAGRALAQRPVRDLLQFLVVVPA